MVRDITLRELKNLASALNREEYIQGLWQMKKGDLLSAVNKAGYEPKYNQKQDKYTLMAKAGNKVKRRNVITKTKYEDKRYYNPPGSVKAERRRQKAKDKK